jgi:hypothetical protein
MSDGGRSHDCVPPRSTVATLRKRAVAKNDAQTGDDRGRRLLQSRKVKRIKVCTNGTGLTR